MKPEISLSVESLYIYLKKYTSFLLVKKICKIYLTFDIQIVDKLLHMYIEKHYHRCYPILCKALAFLIQNAFL